MLYLIEPGQRLDDGLAAQHQLYPQVFASWLKWHDQRVPRMILADDPAQPTTAFGGISTELFLLGDQRCYPGMLADLAAGRIEPAGIWPDEHIRDTWAGNGADHPVLRLESHGQSCHHAALALGYQNLREDDGGHGAYYYYIEGAPRFAGQVQHPCRIVEGLELYELMCTGTDYDPAGTYTRQCLEQGPSFVCEVGGVPVCWSCTHISQALGMIHTPPEFRRNGYARSLAAFQIDYMLQTVGRAWCAVLGNNIASQAMLNSLGLNRLEERIYKGLYRLPDDSAVRL